MLAERRLELGPVELLYRPSPPSEPSAPAVLEALRDTANEERRQRRPLLGPHRDDLEVRWRGRGLRRAASAGEKKLLGMALTAARGRLLAAAGRQPLYLLDDADGDLDRGHLEAAWRLFEGVGQVVATSHRAQAWAAAEGVRKWRLEGGRLEAARRPENGPETEF